MKESLENKFDFEKITFAQIRELLNIVISSQKRDISYLREKYERTAINFSDTTTFLEEASLIIRSGNDLSFEKNGEHDIADIKLKKLIIEALFKSSKKSLFEFHEYIENFIESDDGYIFYPTLETNLNTSGLRNLLIQLGLIEYKSSSRIYIFNNNWNSFLEKRHQKLSARNLAAILKNQENLGTRAEEAVISYEQKILSLFPELLPKINHVALNDVGAGYDILSARPIDGGGYEERFIEVKAVSADKDFYWSINEVTVAKALGNKYYLYLLPVLGNGVFDFENLVIISDPHMNLFQQENARKMEAVSYHVSPNNEYLLSKRAD